MKAKKKRRSNRVASNDWLGNRHFWMVYDAGGIYTGHTLWESHRMAIGHLTMGMGHLPRDGKWRVRKVALKVIT